MFKRIFKNSPLYLLTLSNIAYCIKNGFHWIAWVAFGLSALCLIFDITGVCRGKSK